MLNITIKLEFSKAIIKVPESGLVVKYVLFDEKSKICTTCYSVVIRKLINVTKQRKYECFLERKKSSVYINIQPLYNSQLV